MPPRGRPVPKGRPSPSAPSGSHIVVLGNCRLDVPDALGYELTYEGFSTEIHDVGTLKVYEAVARIITPPIGLSFSLLNPKNVDGPGKFLLQDILHLYNVELPAMSFAANTGKESPFLESCVMDGKYCTLLMRNHEPGSVESELIGAVTFQILPPDCQQAEVPLAAIRHAHQRKGYGALMYKELRRRLMDVGVTSVYCWGDAESETFWSKQGYVKVAEVDGRGKPRKLPIKGDLKKAMSIPGSAALMVSYLDCGLFQTTVSVPPESLKAKSSTPNQAVEKVFSDTPSRLHNSANCFQLSNITSPTTMVTTPEFAGEAKSSHVNTPPQTMSESPELSTGVSHKSSVSITPLNMDGKLFSLAPDSSFQACNLATAPETAEPGVNSLQIVPFAAVPDSESMEPSDNSAYALSVTDFTNDLPATRSPGLINKRTYVRRMHNAARSSGNTLPPRPSGKENISEVKLVVDLEGPGKEGGKLSSFLGPRAKVGQRKASAPKTSNVSAEDVTPHHVKQDGAGLSPLSAITGVIGHESAPESEPLNKSTPAEEKTEKRGRSARCNVNQSEKQFGEETKKDDDEGYSPNGPSRQRTGVKRGRPPKALTSRGEKKVRGATVNDQAGLPGSGATEYEKEKAGPIKRGKPSKLPAAGANKEAATSSHVRKVPSTPVLKTGSEECGQGVTPDVQNSENKAVGKVPAKGAEPPSSSETRELKNRLKRGRPAVVVRTVTKRRKADPPPGSKDSDGNRGCQEADGDEMVENVDGAKDADDGLADTLNILLPVQEDAGGGTSVQGCKDAKEGTSGSSSLGSSLRNHAPVIPRADIPELNHGVDGTGAHPGNIHEQKKSPGSKGRTNMQVASVDGCIVSAAEVPDSAIEGAEEDQESEKPPYVIMFMNMSDDSKKRQLIKHVEKLGGLVTCEGSKCTHVVTMEVRRTLNFCVAMSSGAWILSPDWLKVSVKQKRFVDEEPYILSDKKFEAKYNTSLRDVIPKAQQMPNLLLDGLYIYPSPNVHPPVNTISDIIKAAGGQVLATFEEALNLEKKSLGIVIASEEDTELAMAAAKEGLYTYNSDWLLTCIVKQDLDFSVAQLPESL
ncbi:hypothetical protein Mapa_005070 [Marchantia paleacea]|nr:hypothetical protein Mapa_005070 [Marchantia paleacea]